MSKRINELLNKINGCIKRLSVDYVNSSNNDIDILDKIEALKELKNKIKDVAVQTSNSDELFYREYVSKIFDTLDKNSYLISIIIKEKNKEVRN